MKLCMVCTGPIVQAPKIRLNWLGTDVYSHTDCYTRRHDLLGNMFGEEQLQQMSGESLTADDVLDINLALRRYKDAS